MAEHVCEHLRDAGVKTETLRCVDYAILPGVDADMGDGDEWPKIRQKLVESDILCCPPRCGWDIRPASPSVSSSGSTPSSPIPTTPDGP